MNDRNDFEDDAEDTFEKESLLRNTSTPAHTRNRRVCLLLSCFLAAVVLSAAVGVDIFLRLRWRTEYPFHVEKKFHCGRNAKEAKALGCTFELMTVSWVPLECHDDELNQEFRNARDWRFYSDLKGSREIGETELSEMTVMAYGTNEFHRMHCGYSWMKIHRALETGRRIDKGLSYYKHTTHCAEMYKPANMSAVGTDVNIGFGSC
jgi:hypothetical protein